MLFVIERERALLEAFRPRDRKVVELPRGTEFPLHVRDAFSWLDPFGARTFLLFRDPSGGPLTGIAFRRDQPRGAGPVAHLCDWCHSSGTSDHIGLLTTSASSRRRVGVNVCLDLRCAERLETTANLSGHGVRELTDRLLERMTRFAEEGLGMRVRPS